MNFIKEYQSLALYKRFVHKSRQAKEHILYIFGTVEYAYSLWRSNEVDFYEIIKIALSRFSYGIGFTYLSSSCYEQSLLDVLEKIIQKCIYLPIYHTFTFYKLHFSKVKTPCFLHFSKAKLSISLHFSKIKTSFFLHFSKI